MWLVIILWLIYLRDNVNKSLILLKERLGYVRGNSMVFSDYEKKLTGFIIHGFAVAHATAAALLSQTIVADEMVLVTLTTSMIRCIARINNRSWGIADAISVVGVLSGWYLGTRGTLLLVKWVPGIGNAANAITTFGVTELLGWTSYILVKEDKYPQDLTPEEIELLKKRAEQLKNEEHDESKRLYEQMSAQDKEEYNEIMKQLKNKDLPESTIQYLTKRLETIAAKYVN